MKRAFLGTVFVVLTGAVLFAAPTFSAHLGMDFLNYESETNFLDTGVCLTMEFKSNVEFSTGLNFAITTETIDEIVKPSFYIPLDLGLNFIFPQSSYSFVFGTGLSTVFHYTSREELVFLTGPYVKGGVRVRVHPLMRWFMEVQQDLLIGGDKWINTGTRVFTGINFNFTAE